LLPERCFEVGLPLFRIFLVDSDPNGLGAADQDNQLFPSCDSGIEEVAVQQLEVLGVQGDDDAGSFTTLVFVDGNGPGKGELIHV
jgi:hypothetical protein